ncbi:hypothetical protein KGR20_19040 [Cytobacillus oceanisediminis]|uniref:hypothetical protein n=1 Tax=Cytobacillus oceanisediminis TaxID=665099 RepID=UPI001CCFFE0A|nr:hypothetical protein [Cytobacillus oceanisediminis]MBZ9536274.1 hypothetical protein [Cytobacillus oceanisediminis]
MINVNIDIALTKQETYYVKAVSSQFGYVNRSNELRMIACEVIYFDINGGEISRESYTISGEYFDLLMSESPDFAPGKPLNDYRENDLWYVITLMRNKQERSS